ncbi:hypothetical protein FRC12_009839 [Ceratobasidium sp. 428]|nr:hypothetical protein FRC12_009839 [Ceratobasidium sp. 428]
MPLLSEHISSSPTSPRSPPAITPVSPTSLPTSEPAPICSSTPMPAAAPPAFASTFSSVSAPVSTPAPMSVPELASTPAAASAPALASGLVPTLPVALTPPPKLPFSLVPVAIPSPVAPAGFAIRAPPYSFAPSTPPEPTASPSCTPPPAPVVISTSSSPNPPVIFAGYRVVSFRSSLHQGELSLMSVSPGGTWIFMSTSDENRKCFAITRAYDLNLHAVVNTGNVSATAIDWVTEEDYYIGFSDGKTYRARSESEPITFGEGPDHTAKMTWVTTVEDEGTPSAVTAIAFNRLNGYLAISTSRSVRIFQRRDYDSSRDWSTRASGANDYRAIATLQPFADANPGINSLAFYGFSKVNIIVGAAAGLAVYSTYESKLKIISAMYNHHIIKCAVSPDGRMLAAATIDGRVIHWGLAATGPLFHLSSVITSMPVSGHSSCALPSVSITSTDAIIGAMPSGHFYFHKPSTGERFIGQTNNRNFEVKAVVAHGGRFYVAGVKDSAESIEIVAYSVNRADHAFRERLFALPRLFEPRYNLLADLICELPKLKETPLKMSEAMVLSGVMRQLRRTTFRYLLFFSAVTAVVMLVSGIWNQCIAPLAELPPYDSIPPGTLYLAYGGLCLIRNYTPPGLIHHAVHIFNRIFTKFLLIASRVYKYM